jgi:hypothetical protein
MLLFNSILAGYVLRRFRIMHSFVKFCDFMVDISHLGVEGTR